MNKLCYGCREQKSIDEFGPNTRAKDGRASRCRPCSAAYAVNRRKRIASGSWEATEFRQKNAEMKAAGLFHCPDCRTYKPAEAYWKGTDSGRQAYCIECSKAKRSANAEALATTWREHTVRLRQAAMDAYGGRECACCGESTERFLTIDHIHGGGKAHRAEVGIGKKFYAWLKRNNYPTGYQILCFNCNSGRQLNGGICPHLNAA